MAVLPDHLIHAFCLDGLVEPFDPTMVNPASLDVRLGGTLLIESASGPSLIPYPLEDHNQLNPYYLVPGQFVLAQTKELVRIPNTHNAQFVLKSSRAREGIEHLLAGYLDPGFEGVITLELHNSRQLHPVPIWPNMRIGQIVLSRMETPPMRPYSMTGRYQNAMTVEASKG
jgi:dCTP deaminase